MGRRTNIITEYRQTGGGDWDSIVGVGGVQNISRCRPVMHTLNGLCSAPRKHIDVEWSPVAVLAYEIWGHGA